MTQYPNPVLEGMQMGNQLSLSHLNNFADTMRQAQQISHNAWMQNARDKQRLLFLRAGYNAEGTQENPNWATLASTLGPVLEEAYGQANAAYQQPPGQWLNMQAGETTDEQGNKIKGWLPQRYKGRQIPNE